MVELHGKDSLVGTHAGRCCCCCLAFFVSVVGVLPWVVVVVVVDDDDDDLKGAVRCMIVEDGEDWRCGPVVADATTSFPAAAAAFPGCG